VRLGLGPMAAARQSGGPRKTEKNCLRQEAVR
jgi:hypothetical protein